LALDDPFRGTRDLLDQVRANPLRALENSLDSGNRQPVTRTVTPYALTLHLHSGSKRAVIGGAYEFSMRQSATLEEVWDVNQGATGTPREIVQQGLTGRSLNLKRYDLYTEYMEDIFGEAAFTLLTDRTGSFTIRTQWRPPANAVIASIAGLSPQIRIYEFGDCYIQDFGRQASMGNATVGVDATVMWRTLRRLN
jgi:hypothetical protein